MRRRILALQLKRIGDLVLTAPALGAIRKMDPTAEITLLCEQSSQSLLPALPCHVGFARGTPGFWKTALAGGFEVCLDFTGTDRSALLTLLSRARCRAGFARFKRKFPRALVYNAFVDSNVRDRHTTDHYCDLLRCIGMAGVTPGPSLTLPEDTRETVLHLLEGAGISAPWTVIHPGTARREKEWPSERWAEIARLLAGRGHAVVVTGANIPEEMAQAAEVCSLAPGARDFSGKTSLLELAALIKNASLFCGVDSAAMHLADAVGTPCVCLFGPTNPFHWQPRNTRCRVLRPGTRKPFLPNQRGGPMECITVTEVVQAVESLFSEAI